MKFGKVIGVGVLSLSLLGLGGCSLNPFSKQVTKSTTGSNQAASTSDKGKSDSDTNVKQDNGSSKSSDSGRSSQSGGSVQSSDSGQSNNGTNAGSSTAPQPPKPKPSTPPKTQKEAINDMVAALNTKVPVMLPAGVPVSQGKYLTGTTHSETWYYKASLFETNQPALINSKSAYSGALIATIEGTEYKDEASAKENVTGYTKVDPTQGLTLDLGHGIEAVQNAGMGHSYIMWNEGRWGINIDSPNDPAYKNKKYPDSKKLAEDMVTYLNEYALPIPKDIGVVTVNNWNTNHLTTVTWQFHQMTYEVTSYDPFVALKEAVAMHFMSK